MARDMMLCWGSGSPPCWRAMLVLEEKGLQGYNNKLLSFEKKEHKSEEITSINPRGQVPTFKHGDIVINESMAICDYLESVLRDQGTRLIPDDAAGKGHVLQRRSEAQNLHNIGQEQLVHYLMRTKKEDQNEDLTKEKIENLRKELDIWEGYLKQQAGQGGYICGKFSVADCILFPTLALQVRLGLKLADKWPHLQSYYNLMCERPSVTASWPPHWKDSEGKDVLSGV